MKSGQSSDGKKPGTITKKMLIGDIVAKNRDAAVVMMEYGMHCVGCMIASNETLEQGACAHGMDEKTVDEMVKRINALAKK